MTHQGTVMWSGASGTAYTYYVYQLPATFDPNQNGNYIYAKVVNNMWQPIYIGQGDLSARTDIDKHHQSSCLKAKGATHVHVHLNGREQDRLNEEQDLIKANSIVYKPNGCNEKTGG